MTPSKRERPNQKRARRHRAIKDTKAVPLRRSVQLSPSLDDELGTALALAFSIELMGFGWESFGDDYSNGLLTVTRLLIEHLTTARTACRALRADGRSSSSPGAAAQTAKEDA